MRGQLWHRIVDVISDGGRKSTYHVAHWVVGTGFRSGQTWSPDTDSRPGALVHLAEQMSGLAQKPAAEREDRLRQDAQKLLDRLQ